MGNLSKRLSRFEFACECGCGFDTVDIELVDLLEDVADHFFEEIVGATRIIIQITSGCRCVKHNDAVLLSYDPDYVPGTSKSQHIYARASDFKLFAVFEDNTREQVNADLVADYLESEYKGKFGIGRYHNRTHADTRTNGPARWDMT